MSETTKTNSTTTKNQMSTLAFLEVGEIRDDTLVLKNGNMRAVIAISSANFALKSGSEQQIIVNNFQGVLNSLDSEIQILVQSRKLNLDPYIEKLRQLEDQQQNDLLRIKMQEYIEYIKQMLDQVNIMKKDFYIVVGYESLSDKIGFLTGFLRSLQPTKIIKKKREDFIKDRSMLMQRVDQIMSRFAALDLKVDLLNTEQLIGLMYNSYNPDTLDTVRLKDIASLNLDSY